MHQTPFRIVDKTSYLIFSIALYAKAVNSAERKTKRMMEYLTDAKEFSKDPKPEKLVSVKRNPYYEVKNIKLEFEMTLDPWLESSMEDAIGQIAGDLCGWFKLQSSKRLEMRDALDLYHQGRTSNT
jgi:hypothetical protein